MAIRKNSVIMDLINGLDLRLGYVGYASVDRQWRTDRLATPFNRLYFIEEGSGVLGTEKEKMNLVPGKAYLLPAGLPCSYHCDDSLSLLFFHFNLADRNRIDLMQGVEKLAAVDFTSDELAELKALCESDGYTDAFSVICTINNLLLAMNRKYHFRWNAPPEYSPIVAAAVATINRELSSSLRIETLAKQSFVSPTYLARRFKSEVGVTIRQYINMQLINASQWQLGNTDASVESISSSLGFCNQFYFSEWFKKRCRVSPLQYRNGTKY